MALGNQFIAMQAGIRLGTRVACVGYGFAGGASPSPIFWRYTLQPWVVPCTSIFRIFSSREVWAVTRQLPNRYQSYVLESPWIKVLSKGPMVLMSSDTSRFSQRLLVEDEISIW